MNSTLKMLIRAWVIPAAMVGSGMTASVTFGAEMDMSADKMEHHHHHHMMAA